MQVLPLAQKIFRIAKKVGNEVMSSPNGMGFCAGSAVSIVIAVVQTEESRKADEQNEIKHDQRCKELKNALRESERKLILVVKKEAAQPSKNLKELLQTHDKQHSSSWFWTDSRVNFLQAKLESFQKEAEVKEKMYLDAIEGLANVILDIDVQDHEKKAHLEEVLQSAGVEKFTPEVGEQLDTEKHSVVHLIPDLKNPPGMIVQVLEEGYICNGRILRCAKVGVSRAVETRGRSKNA
ncbi:uncharacterized protein LOC113764913 [Coffea eugenioides]|uniref:uncharacterized protein LOC113764913 n=1 Tax=Coffea eugenioides TaxID=49369 RepID=UPI000F606D3A|nr:uncharacterized protein LOC113764913 [Coffea eugenioides]